MDKGLLDTALPNITPNEARQAAISLAEAALRSEDDPACGLRLALDRLGLLPMLQKDPH